MADSLVKLEPKTIQRTPQPTLEFSEEQIRMILDSFMNGASKSEAAPLLELARQRGLNPFTRQIHFVKRWDSEKSTFVWAAQVGIDGFRSLAERTGLYDGQDEAENEYIDIQGRKVLVLSRVRIYRKGWSRPAVGVARYAEFCQRKKDGNPNRMWAEKPHVMLEKCAEAQAFRKAFPEDLSGLYIPEELGDEHSPDVEQPARADALKGRIRSVLPQKAKVAETSPIVAEKSPPASPPRTGKKMPPIEDVDEPPPPGDDDAPPYIAAPADMSDEPQLPPPAQAPVVMPFGKGKGQPLEALQKKDLAWYAKVLAESIADPVKAQYLASNQRLFDAIQAEVERRAQG